MYYYTSNYARFNASCTPNVDKYIMIDWQEKPRFPASKGKDEQILKNFYPSLFKAFFLVFTLLIMNNYILFLN